MAKLDKSLYTKDEWRAVKHQRAQDKARLRAMKTGQPMPAPTPTPTIPTATPTATPTQIRLPLEGNIAFVLGNGLSRKNIKLDHLREWGRIYGCNALYREFEPDFLVAVDAKMVTEICESNWQLKHPVWTNPNKNMEKFRGLNFFKPSQGWSSGPTALWLATSHEHTTLYILGFDYVGTQEGKLNNMYGSTRNYRRLTDPATYHGNWLRQTGIVIQKNPKKQYIRVVQDDRKGFQAEEFCRFHNYSEMIVSDFRNAFCRPRPVQN
jgi:hypothetical protein